MKKTEQLYEGKAKKVYATDDDSIVIVSYKEQNDLVDKVLTNSLQYLQNVQDHHNNTHTIKQYN